MSVRRLLGLALGGALGSGAILVAAGCYNPEGGTLLLSRFTGAATTYWSTEDRPVTITVVDTRTEKPFFTMEVPVGKQLTMDFKEGGGDDPVQTPDLMRWEVFPIRTEVGTLHNAMSVPDRWARRIDVDYRPGPEYARRPGDEDLRIDGEHPDWWSSKGGRREDANTATRLYDE